MILVLTMCSQWLIANVHQKESSNPSIFWHDVAAFVHMIRNSLSRQMILRITHGFQLYSVKKVE